jgi:hypothetical protein
MGPDERASGHYRTRTALPAPPPPRPDSIGPTLSPVPASGPKGWRKFFAIAGIVFGFFFLLTIPGWVGLFAYRKWKAGERDEPKVLIAWGAIMSSLFAVGLVIAIISGIFSNETASPSSPSRTTQHIPTSGDGLPAGTYRWISGNGVLKDDIVVRGDGHFTWGSGWSGNCTRADYIMEGGYLCESRRLPPFIVRHENDVLNLWAGESDQPLNPNVPEAVFRRSS